MRASFSTLRASASLDNSLGRRGLVENSARQLSEPALALQGHEVLGPAGPGLVGLAKSRGPAGPGLGRARGKSRP